MPARGKLVTAVLYTLLAAALAWPALYNGQPFFFPDTTAYIRGADAGVQALTHRHSPWSLAESGGADPAVAAAAATHPSVSSIRDKTVLSGRSPFYGALLYLGDLAGGFWLSVAAQALAALAALILTVRALHMPQPRTALLAGALLAGLSSLPFFVSLLMPDVFAGLAILGGAVLLGGAARPTPGAAALWLLLLTAAAAFHDSLALLLAALLALAVLTNLLRREWRNARGALVVSAAVALAALAQLGFAATVRHFVGAPPLRPPFLMARLLEDGPGLRYLRAQCPQAPFEACHYLGRLPMSADDFLWLQDPARGVFAVATPEARRRLSAEQLRFAAAVVRFDPQGVLAAALRNTWLQGTLLGLREFRYDETEKASFEAKIPAPHLARLHGSAAYRDAMPLRAGTLLMRAGFYGALGLLLGVLAWRPARAALPAGLASIAGWVLAGVALNAAICGVLSGPHERYSARVAWLLPFLALLVCAALLRRAPGYSGWPASAGRTALKRTGTER